ncbi:MAG: hypothetical protein H6Q78_1753 [Candidatus Krumholzibacteriota bacterium]|nr:hypothetical protein [Candidatus Krumholzibacteriota bacterium]
MMDFLKRLMGEEAPDRSAGSGGTEDRGGFRRVHLAACAVLLEMAGIDNEFDERERRQILDALRCEYGLADEEVAALERAAEVELSKAKGHWSFTNVINQDFSNEEKSRLVELLWRLVYADGRLDEHENYFIHKLAKLLRLTHRDLIDAKLKVLHGNPPSGDG